jgi:hypothetical protein
MAPPKFRAALALLRLIFSLSPASVSCGTMQQCLASASKPTYCFYTFTSWLNSTLAFDKNQHSLVLAKPFGKIFVLCSSNLTLPEIVELA